MHRMQLNLKNPVVFIDLETTGIDIEKTELLKLPY